MSSEHFNSCPAQALPRANQPSRKRSKHPARSGIWQEGENPCLALETYADGALVDGGDVGHGYPSGTYVPDLSS